MTHFNAALDDESLELDSKESVLIRRRVKLPEHIYEEICKHIDVRSAIRYGILMHLKAIPADVTLQFSDRLLDFCRHQVPGMRLLEKRRITLPTRFNWHLAEGASEKSLKVTPVTKKISPGRSLAHEGSGSTARYPGDEVRRYTAGLYELVEFHDAGEYLEGVVAMSRKRNVYVKWNTEGWPIDGEPLHMTPVQIKKFALVFVTQDMDEPD